MEKERVDQTIYRGKDLEDSDYLTPEQKEYVSRETKDIEVNWNDFSDQLDEARKRYSVICGFLCISVFRFLKQGRSLIFRVESGEKDLQDLAQYHVEYDVIITWIITNEKRLSDVKGDDGKDRENIEKQRVILKVGSSEKNLH